MQNRKGLVHIYCGDGKGKTSAAVGLAVRAAGRGMKVLMVRFLKTEDSGEVEVLRSIPCITVTPCDRTFGFVFRMTAPPFDYSFLLLHSAVPSAGILRVGPHRDTGIHQ